MGEVQWSDSGLGEREHLEFIDHIDGIVWEADTCFRFSLVSRQAERLLGYPLERWLKEPGFWAAHVHPEDRDWAVALCKQATKECRPHEFEYRMVAADGRTVWLRDIVSVISKNGRPVRLRGIMVDVTAQHQDREELERTVSLLRATLDSTTDGLLVVDRSGHVTAFNRKFQQIWRLSDEMLGSRRDDRVIQNVLSQLVEPERFLARVRQLYAAPEEESFEILELHDGRIIERYSRPQRLGETIVGRVWSFRDVTQRVRAERERDLLLHEAHEAIQLRDDFLSIAAHELKTPLTPLKLHLQVLKQRLTSGQSLSPTLLDKALSQVGRLSGLINDLLDASRIEVGRLELEREPIVLQELVREVTSDFRPVCSHHIFEDQGPAEPLVILGDRSRLAQVLTNLLENAVKYSPMGGKVRVMLERHGEAAVLSVTDAGIGIPADQQTQLFERFFRARNAPISGFGGLGLGLYICRDIIERHGGHIWVESELGHGATFCFSLPVARHDA